MSGLNPQGWKDAVTSRGAKYHYYYSAAQGNKVTLLFVHGYPSLARDWRKMIAPLEKLGYGIVAPDMFGYGGTDKPADPAQYRLKLLSKDLADLLDAENLKQAVVVGHDWGSFVVSRLANYFPKRILALAVLAVPFGIPDPNMTFEHVVGFMVQQLGYNPYGYWDFFNEDDAADVLATHFESAAAITYTKDQSIFSEIVCPKGAMKEALLSDYIPPAGIADYLDEEDINAFREIFKKETFRGPLNYYKCEVRGFNKTDETAIPDAQRVPPATVPIFFGVGTGDVICTPKIGRMVFGMEPFKNHNITIKEFDGDHWLTLSHGSEIARELDAWVSDVVVPS